MNRSAGTRWAVLILLLLFWTLSLRHLAVIPPVYGDEPWQASTGWKLATGGVFGSELFAGLDGMEQRYYGYMPIHPLLLAFVFKGAGVGLLQARFETVSLGLLVLALTYSLALCLFHDRRIGLLAMALLLLTRTLGQTPSQITGTILIDTARIARYDMGVPVFGLAALHATLWARDRNSGRGYFIAGFLTALATLSHLYGLFWLPILLIIIIWDRLDEWRSGTRDWRLLGANLKSPITNLLLGFTLPLLPYLAYVLVDLPAWRAQTGVYGERFRLLDPAWYLDNLLREPRRYGPGLGPFPAGWLRPGFWATAVVLPAALVALWRRSFKGDKKARALAVPAAVMPLLFALLIHLKLSNYLAAMAPLWTVVAAWAGVAAWRRLGGSRFRQWGRALLAVLLLAVATEGAMRVVIMEQAAHTTTPYADFVAKIRTKVPTGARVLGLHHYWFGMEDTDYRSFVVPIAWSSGAGAIPFRTALNRVAPDVVLVDQRLRAFLDDHPDAAAQLATWLDQHQTQPPDRITDDTYGTMEIYRLNPSPN